MIVRKLRLQRGWTQEQLAKLTGLNVRSIQRIERGQAISLESRNALAAVFEVDRSTFRPGEPVMEDAAPVTRDEAEAIEYVKGIKEFYQHLFLYLVFAVTFGLVFGFDQPFIYWGVLGWGVGVVINALHAFDVVSFGGARWERRQIEKRLGRAL
jgi:XRE family transcriptional regulator, regulator of sulfur utilization